MAYVVRPTPAFSRTSSERFGPNNLNARNPWTPQEPWTVALRLLRRSECGHGCGHRRKVNIVTTPLVGERDGERASCLSETAGAPNLVVEGVEARVGE